MDKERYAPGKVLEDLEGKPCKGRQGSLQGKPYRGQTHLYCPLLSTSPSAKGSLSSSKVAGSSCRSLSTTGCIESTPDHSWVLNRNTSMGFWRESSEAT